MIKLENKVVSEMSWFGVPLELSSALMLFYNTMSSHKECL